MSSKTKIFEVVLTNLSNNYKENNMNRLEDMNIKSDKMFCKDDENTRSPI